MLHQCHERTCFLAREIWDSNLGNTYEILHEVHLALLLPCFILVEAFIKYFHMCKNYIHWQDSS
jgi:hypothetical protein